MEYLIGEVMWWIPHSWCGWIDVIEYLTSSQLFYPNLDKNNYDTINIHYIGRVMCLVWESVTLDFQFVYLTVYYITQIKIF